jgi:tetratricopeptide (TPR) repeat protein
MVKAKQFALKALALDGSLVRARAALGLVKEWYEWDWPAAEREYREAIELAPSESSLHYLYGRELFILGRRDEALAEFQRAAALDPLSVRAVIELGHLYAAQGEHDKAMVEWTKAVEIEPTFPTTYEYMGTSYCQRGRLAEAIAALQNAITVSPEDPLGAGVLGHCYAISGHPDEARNLLRGIEEQSRASYVDPMIPALVHVGLGETDQALDLVERACELHALLLPFLAGDPRFDPLRSEPRFQDVLRRIGLTSHGGSSSTN